MSKSQQNWNKTGPKCQDPNTTPRHETTREDRRVYGLRKLGTTRWTRQDDRSVRALSQIQEFTDRSDRTLTKNFELNNIAEMLRLFKFPACIAAWIHLFLLLLIIYMCLFSPLLRFVCQVLRSINNLLNPSPYLCFVTYTLVPFQDGTSTLRLGVDAMGNDVSMTGVWGISNLTWIFIGGRQSMTS